MSAFQTFCLSPSAGTPATPRGRRAANSVIWKHRTTACVLPKGKTLIDWQDRSCPFQQTTIEYQKLRNYRTRPKLSFSVRAIVLRRVANWALEAIGHFAMIASSRVCRDAGLPVVARAAVGLGSLSALAIFGGL